MSFRANAVSRGIFPSGRFYLALVHLQTWWIPPLRLRCGRNDIPEGRAVQPHRLYSERGGRLVAAPTWGTSLCLRRTFVFIHLAQKRMSKFGKKHLTNRWRCGNICKLSDERPPNGPEGGETLKNSLKKVKKGLDKLLRMC